MPIQVNPKPRKSLTPLVVFAVVIGIGFVIALAPLALPVVLALSAGGALAWWVLQ